jgi:uncharacterized delta-60 repeat protein
MRGGRLRRLLVAAGALVLAVGAGRALAAAGALDTSFSDNGKLLLNFHNGNHTDRAYDVAMAGGKIVLAGITNNSGDDDFAIARLKADGSPDGSFSGDGRRAVSLGGNYEYATAVAVQRDGKIVAVGYSASSAGGGRFVIVRLTAGGELDHTFSGDGKRFLNFGPTAFSISEDVTIQPNGMIVVVGINEDPNPTFAVARLKPNGQPDTSFSGDGKRTVPFAGGSSDAHAVAIGPGGTIVMAGYSNAESAFALARLKSNGNLDSSFSGNGKVSVPFANFGAARGVAVQRNGKVVAAGYEQDAGGNRDFAITKFTEAGQLDSSFSGDGIRTQSFDNGTNDDEANDVALQGDGKIVVVGQSAQNATGFDFAIARFRSGGGLDTSFAGDGKRLQSFGNNGSNPDLAEGVAIQSDQKIVVAGSSDPTGAPRDDMAIARYLGS